LQARPSPLPDLGLQYADYASWQRRWMAGPVLAQQLEYWKDNLADAPASLDLPADRPRPAVQTHRGASVPFELSPSVTSALRSLGQAEDATLFMALLAAFQLLLSRYTGQDDIVVGTATANRAQVELEPLIGFFVNTLALRTDLAGDPTFRELI